MRSRRALPAPARRRSSMPRAALWREHQDVLVHTHIAENKREIEWTAEAVSRSARNYLDVYDHHGLIGRRAVLAHGVHLSEDELCRCHESGTALAHCPTSNLFLGSGLFRIARREGSAPPGAGRARHRHRRRHQLLAARHDGRGLRDRAARRARAERGRGVLPGDARRRARARARRPHRHDRARAARPISRCSIRTRRRC